MTEEPRGPLWRAYSDLCAIIGDLFRKAIGWLAGILTVVYLWEKFQ
jgi:hypothetical protein